jgi:hypothetical protein
MHTNIASPNLNALLSNALGIVAIVFVAIYLIGWKVPLVTSDRAAFLWLTAIGFGMCMLGMGRTAVGLGWTHPITLLGIVLGSVLVLLVIAVLAGWRLPLIAGDRAAFLAVAVLGLVKWGLGIFSRAFLNV